MNKTTKLLTVFALVCVLMTSVLVACAPHEHTFDQKWSSDETYHWHASTCEHTDEVSAKGKHEDANKDGLCDKCSYVSCTHTYATEWSSDANGHWHASTCGHNVKADQAGHTDANKDALCDVCGYDSGEHIHTYETDWSFDADGHWHASNCEHTGLKKDESAHVDNNNNFVCDECEYVLHTHTPATEWTTDIDGHWHKTTCGHDVKLEYGIHADEDKDNKCDVCLGTIYETVTYTFDAAGKATGKSESDQVFGIFTVGAGTEIRSRSRTYTDPVTGDVLSFSQSVKVNGDTAAFYVKAPGTGKLSLYVQNGSSGAVGEQKLLMYKDDATTAETISYEANGNSSPVVRIELQLEAGTYKFMCGGTTDVYHAEFSAVVEKSNVASIQVTNTGVVDYLVGSALDTSGLVVEKVYENLRTEIIDSKQYVVDDSQFNKDVAGEYTITIKYTEDGQEFTTEYSVRVYAVEDISVGTNAIRQVDKDTKTDPASSKYNGSYANTAFKQLYFVGETFSQAGLSVTAHGACGSVKKDFIFTEGFEVAGHDTSKAGVQTVTVSMYDKSKQLTIHVVEQPTTEGNIKCYVDATNSAVGTYDLTHNAYTFTTIQQALDFLEALDLPWNVKKIIKLAPGTYNEKLEITIANLSIQGDVNDATKTLIEWDSLYGQKDESGFTHTTESTATLAVRYNAEGFQLVGVTVSNYWNSVERFNEGLGQGQKERGLALLVQADKVVINSSRLLGYQDTVEFFTGRSYVVDSYIAGTTDFIFGSNASVLFEGCEIRSIKAHDNKGGYVTAFKGNNGNSKVEYGVVFYSCNFTCDEGVASYSESDPNAKGLTAIGRPWGPDATVAVINCQLGGHISKAPSTGAERGERYVTMSGNLASSARFVEYNNTGLGAITESQVGVTMLTAEQAANYIDLGKLFGMTNGQVKFDSQWNGSNAIEQVNVLDAQGNAVATYYGYHGTTPTAEDIIAVIKAPNGMVVEGLYTDSALTTAFAPVKLNDTVVVYVKFAQKQTTGVTYTLQVPTTLDTTYTSDTLINDIFYLTQNVKIEKIKITGASYEADGLVFDQSQISLTKAKMQYNGGVWQNAIYFTVEEGKTATVVIYAAQKSDKSTSLAVMDSSQNKVTVTNLKIDGVASDSFDTLPTTYVSKYEFTLTAGTYYIGGAGGGPYIYGMSVTIE